MKIFVTGKSDMQNRQGNGKDKCQKSTPVSILDKETIKYFTDFQTINKYVKNAHKSPENASQNSKSDCLTLVRMAVTKIIQRTKSQTTNN